MGYFRKAVRGKWFPSSETGQRLGVRNTVTDTISTWCNELQSLTKAHVIVTLPSRGLRSTHKCQTRPFQSQSNTQIPQYVFVSFIHSYISVLIPFGSSPLTLSRPSRSESSYSSARSMLLVSPSASPELTFFPVFLIVFSTVSKGRVSVTTVAVCVSRDTS